MPQSVSLNIIYSDFYINLTITDTALFQYIRKGSIENHKRIYRKSNNCFCGVPESDIEHILKVCPQRGNYRNTYFPKDWGNMDIKELLFDTFSTIGIRKIMKEYFDCFL